MSDPNTHVVVVLPAYNEAVELPRLINRVNAAASSIGRCSILVVDDGSSDETASIARSFASHGVSLVQHKRNQGLGAAINTGLCAALEMHDCTHIVTMDADNTHDPLLIATLLRESNEKDLDIVIASRYADGGREVGLTFKRKLFSRAASTFLRVRFRVNGARDLTCGYRLYRASFLRAAVQRYGGSIVRETGFTCMVELLVKLCALGARVGEAPLVLRYDLKAGPSKMRVRRTIVRYAQIMMTPRFVRRGMVTS